VWRNPRPHCDDHNRHLRFCAPITEIKGVGIISADTAADASIWDGRSAILSDAQSRDRYSKSIGEARLMVGKCVRMMCRAPKCRAGCHFAAPIGLRSMLEDFAPEIPDFPSQHTFRGKAMGRGIDRMAEQSRVIRFSTDGELTASIMGTKVDSGDIFGPASPTKTSIPNQKSAQAVPMQRPDKTPAPMP
jgi:hypothetical protein